MEYIITEEYKEVRDYLDNNDSGFVFFTGKAGTGKSTFVEYYKKHTTKTFVLLAPTGIAALNIGGSTIHSFFKFPHYMRLDFKPEFDHILRSIINTVDIIIIDEISMVRADIMDNIDQALRFNGDADKPFGGLLILSVGDLFQLPPVLTDNDKEEFNKKYSTPYFFSAKALVRKDIKFKKFQLTKVFRQSDLRFVNLLNSIREGFITGNTINRINEKIQINSIPNGFNGTVLCTMNKTAESINENKLDSIKSESCFYRAKIKGDVKMKDFPTQENLELKVGTKILFCKNTSFFKNGETGIVIKLNKKSINVKKEDGSEVNVIKEKWEYVKYIAGGKPLIIGEFTQLPIKLGWAITIHKSQGMTFTNEVIIDTGNGCFASGQFYVALSRVSDPSKVKLLKQLRITDIISDKRVHKFIIN